MDRSPRGWRHLLLPILVPILLALVGFQHPGAELQWRYGGPGTDRGVHVAPTRDGGAVIAGATDSSGAGGRDVYLVRTGPDGESLWSRTFGGPGTDNGWAVLELDDGYVVAGFTDSFGAGGLDCYLVRTDAQGRERWSRPHGGPGNERCWGLAAVGDGGFVLVGETSPVSEDPAAEPPEDCLLLRVDGDGRQLWRRTYGGEDGDRCFAVAMAADGGAMIAGQTYSEGAGDRDMYVLGTDAEGELRWSRTFGGAESDVGHAVSANAEGDFLVTGYTASLASEGVDPYLVRIDSAGTVHWQRTIATPHTGRTLTGEQTPDGGFCLGGLAAAPGSDPDRPRTAALVLRTDGEGSALWSREILPTEQGLTFGYTVRATADGACLITGHTTEGSAGGPDVLLAKVFGPS